MSKKERDKKDLILDAVFAIISEAGIAAVSARSVAKEAGVALGLVNYHFKDKHNLICAALSKFEEFDLEILHVRAIDSAQLQLKKALQNVASKRYLSSDYLSLRMQLWSLAKVHKDFARINSAAHQNYLKGLQDLIEAARPEVGAAEAKRRAIEIDLIQNGMWLSALLGTSASNIKQAVELTHEIALGKKKLR